MLSAIYVTIVILALYVYARILKDHRVFTNLVVCAALAFVIGSCIKSNIYDANKTVKSERVITASNPTIHSLDSTVVWTESSEQYVQSQDTMRDTVIPQTETLVSQLQNVEIEDDS